ncbi:alpha/beta hydrolase [Bizionia argentinensis JUB59]|uniref:Alpha/beta hydrolase n=1 Tax=Bizionia argentinensis JUB59 TaxID=1046627 RepID=G2EAC2_9FLAO|nr:alpha/beta hydrolase [Bizionia argentinensis]EGV44605.1 alpha/beta hydrolase [Bizionia argentinensis JUB59]
MKTIQKIIGILINFAGLFSKETAARMAMYLFTTPRSGQINEKQSDFLDTSLQEEIMVENIPVMTYRWFGKGETILLAHGWESNSARWQYLIDPLLKLNFNIIALDAPAHGRSGSKRFNAVLYGEFIKVVSKKHKADFLIGHSVGGMASVFSQNNSEYRDISKIILLGAPAEFTDVLDRYYKMMCFSKRTIKAINQLIKDRLQAGPESFSTAKYLECLTIDGLIIHDEKDGIIPYQDALILNMSLRNSKLVTTTGFGHSLIDESISNHIYEFLKS